jgi:hypothetical protein
VSVCVLVCMHGHDVCTYVCRMKFEFFIESEGLCCSLAGYGALQSDELLPQFQRNMLGITLYII